MPGLLPNEGENLILNIILKRTFGTDRDASLELGLFTNTTIGEATAHSALTEPSGTGYARIDLNDASWTVVGDLGSYAQQIFTAGLGGWSGEVQGYFICTKAAGGTKRILAIEMDGFQTLASAQMTRSGSVVTVNTPVAHGFSTGDRVNIRGANETDYNGIVVITVTDADTFTFAIGSTPASPATGTITVNRCYIMNANDNYRVTPQITGA